MDIKVLDKGFVRLIDWMGDDSSIVQAARVSYGDGTKTKREDAALINYLWKHQHLSPFEMCLDGDTVIPCYYTYGVTSKSYTIKQLADAFHDKGKNNSWVKLVYIRTVNADGSISKTKIKNAIKTGVKKVYRITEDSLLKREITLTDNHPILTPTGYKKLSDLSVGDEIYQNGVNESIVELWASGHCLRQISEVVGMTEVTILRRLKKLGVNTKRRKGLFERKKSGEYKDPRAKARRLQTGKICEVSGLISEEIHHLDEDPHNNDISNLIPVTRRVHKAFHNKNYYPDIVYVRKIAKIEYLGEKEVYDLEVESDNHNFVANGFVVHNCEIKLHMKLPIFVARQMVRHRTFSFNEYSGRYSVMKPEFYIPQRLLKQSSDNKQCSSQEEIKNSEIFINSITQSCESAYKLYEGMLEEGVSRELARIILPLNTYTEWYAKVDLRNLFNFLKLRLDKTASLEIQEYARAIAEIVRVRCPLAYKAFEEGINEQEGKN